MKHENVKDILYGTHIGEHGYDVDEIINEIKTQCIDRGMNFVTIRTPKRVQIAHEYFIKWARFLAENKIYFIFLYTLQFAPEGKESQFTPELVSEIKKIAGEYFLGDMLGELGSVFAAKMPGYYVKGHAPMPPQGIEDMQVGKDDYVDAVRRYVDVEKKLGMDKVGISVVEATVLTPYNLEAGTDIPISELMGQSPEPTMASLRGSAKAYGCDLWGTYFAHEWYAGHYHDDALKRKRVELEYKYAYMNGSRMFCLESGDDVISAYGRNFSPDSEISRECRDFLNSFGEYIKKDRRPEGMPIAKVAFVQGNLDSWRGETSKASCAGSFVWSQFSGREWGYSDPEWSWQILSEIQRKPEWWEFDSYAARGKNLSSLPPYGLYDIIPASAPVEVMDRYDTLIYAGWNTMTEEQLSKLEAFVEKGGTLLMTAAHLNSSVKRQGEYTPVRDGDLRKLFGVKLSGKTFEACLGTKFSPESLIEGFKYPSSGETYCDPLYSAGYVDYADAELAGGTVRGTLEDNFHFNGQPGQATVVENALGKGRAILLTSVNYPGQNALFPLYRFMVKELLRVGVERADVAVSAPESVRYAVYSDGTVYLLNTDYDHTAEAEILTPSGIERLTLKSLELRRVNTNVKIN